MSETVPGHAELVERAHKILMSELFLICQPDRGDVFGFMDDHPEVLKPVVDALSTPIAAHGAGAVTEAKVRAGAEAVKAIWGSSDLSPAFTLISRTVLEAALRPDEAAGWLTNCCHCKRIIDKREAKDGGDPFGAELNDGRWTCSIECWTAVVDPAPDEAAGQGEAERLTVYDPFLTGDGVTKEYVHEGVEIEILGAGAGRMPCPWDCQPVPENERDNNDLNCVECKDTGFVMVTI